MKLTFCMWLDIHIFHSVSSYRCAQTCLDMLEIIHNIGSAIFQDEIELYRWFFRVESSYICSKKKSTLKKGFSYISRKWNFLALRIKIFLVILEKKNSYISGNGTFRPTKNSSCSWKWNFLALILKKNLYFLKKKSFLTFRERNPLDSFLHLTRELSKLEKYKNLLWKHFLYFGKWNFLTSSLKNSHISERNLQSLKNKQKICPEWIFSHMWRFYNLNSSIGK